MVNYIIFPATAILLCSTAFAQGIVDRAAKTELRRTDATTRPRVERDDDGQVTALILSGMKLAPEEAAELPDLKQLRRLVLFRTNFSDQDLKHLERCTKLEHLNLTSTEVTDVAVDSILKLDQLKTLCLGNVNITPQAINKLKAGIRKRDQGIKWRYTQRRADELPWRNEQAQWISARPTEVTVAKDGMAKILDDHSVRLEGDVRWQEASLGFEFDTSTSVEEIRLEILPVDSPAGPRFGRGGRKLIVFDIKPSIKDQDGKSSRLDFTSCTYLQNPSDETTAGCIDYLTDTGWTVPNLPADAVAHELVLRFEKPIVLRPGQRLTLTVDSGGGDELAVLNRIRFAFPQAAVSKPVDDGAFAEPRGLAPGTRVEIAVADAKFAFRWCPAGDFKMGAFEDARMEYGDRFVPPSRRFVIPCRAATFYTRGELS
jgi:hypothetical protein